MKEFWICAGCKSLNRANADSCYHCGARREGGAAATLVGASSEGLWAPGSGRVPEAVQIAFARYRSGRHWALVAIAGTAAVTFGTLVVQLALAVLIVLPATETGFDAQRLAVAAPLIMAAAVVLAGAWLAAFVGWLMWLRRAVLNVPTLGGGPRPASTRGVFGWWLVPFANLVKPGRIVQEVHARTAIPGSQGGRIVAGWWLTWVASQLVGWFGSFTSIGVITRGPKFFNELTTLQLALSGLSLALFVLSGLLGIAAIRQIDHNHAVRAAAIRESIMNPPGSAAADARGSRPGRSGALAAFAGVLGVAMLGGFAVAAASTPVSAEAVGHAMDQPPKRWAAAMCDGMKQVEALDAPTRRLAAAARSGDLRAVEGHRATLERGAVVAGRAFARSGSWRPGDAVRARLTAGTASLVRGLRLLGHGVRARRSGLVEQGQALTKRAAGQFEQAETEIRLLETKHGGICS